MAALLSAIRARCQLSICRKPYRLPARTPPRRPSVFNNQLGTQCDLYSVQPGRQSPRRAPDCAPLYDRRAQPHSSRAKVSNILEARESPTFPQKLGGSSQQLEGGLAQADNHDRLSLGPCISGCTGDLDWHRQSMGSSNPITSQHWHPSIWRPQRSWCVRIGSVGGWCSTGHHSTSRRLAGLVGVQQALSTPHLHPANNPQSG